MLPSINQREIREMLFSLGYNFKQSDKDLLELPYSYFKDKYDWLIDYKKDKADKLQNSFSQFKGKKLPKVR